MIYLLVFPSALIFCAPLVVYVFLCDTSLLPIKRSRVISTYACILYRYCLSYVDRVSYRGCLDGPNFIRGLVCIMRLRQMCVVRLKMHLCLQTWCDRTVFANALCVCLYAVSVCASLQRWSSLRCRCFVCKCVCIIWCLLCLLFVCLVRTFVDDVCASNVRESFK